MKNIYKLKAYGKCFELTAVKHSYCVDDSLAIELVDNKNHECFAMLTVNLSESLYCKLPEDVQAVDVNNCPWAEKFIEENKLGKPLGITIRSGYCDYPLYKFDLSKLVSEESSSESNESPSDLLEYLIYGEMCTYCPNAKLCHEECEYCDEFLLKQEEVNKIYYEEEGDE